MKSYTAKRRFPICVSCIALVAAIGACAGEDDDFEDEVIAGSEEALSMRPGCKQNDMRTGCDAPNTPELAVEPITLSGRGRFTRKDRTDCYRFHLDGNQGIQLDITPKHATQDLAVNFFQPDGRRGACGGTCSGGAEDDAPFCTGTTIRYTYSNWIPGDYEVCLGDGEALIASACKSSHAPVGPYRLDVSFYDAPGGGTGFSTGHAD